MISPVTATAEVAVNKAVMKGGCVPSAVASGVHKASVPSTIAPAKSRGINRIGSRIGRMAPRKTRALFWKGEKAAWRGSGLPIAPGLEKGTGSCDVNVNTKGERLS